MVDMNDLADLWLKMGKSPKEEGADLGEKKPLRVPDITADEIALLVKHTFHKIKELITEETVRHVMRKHPELVKAGAIDAPEYYKALKQASQEIKSGLDKGGSTYNKVSGVWASLLGLLNGISKQDESVHLIVAIAICSGQMTDDEQKRFEEIRKKAGELL